MRRGGVAEGTPAFTKGRGQAIEGHPEGRGMYSKCLTLDCC